MKTAVNVQDLSVIYDRKTQALNQVSLKIPEGQITGLIGPSGSGKTTLIEAVVGRLKIAPGKITVLGQTADAKQLRREVAFMPQNLAIYDDLTVRQNLMYFAKIIGLKNGAAKQNVADILRAVDLVDKTNTLVADLSGGQQQRVSLAAALLGQPKLLVLDEPTVGLDPVLIENLWKLFHKLVTGAATMVISSHSMNEAARCDYVILMRDGGVVFAGSPAQLLAQTKMPNVEQAFLKLAGGEQHDDKKELK